MKVNKEISRRQKKQIPPTPFVEAGASMDPSFSKRELYSSLNFMPRMGLGGFKTSNAISSLAPA